MNWKKPKVKMLNVRMKAKIKKYEYEDYYIPNISGFK